MCDVLVFVDECACLGFLSLCGGVSFFRDVSISRTKPNLLMIDRAHHSYVSNSCKPVPNEVGIRRAFLQFGSIVPIEIMRTVVANVLPP